MTKDELQAKRAVALSELKNIEVALCLDEHYIDIIEKENAELKADNDARKFAMAMSEKVEKQLREQLTKAKEIIALGLRVCETSSIEYMNLYQKQAEQFLKEIEK